MALTADGSFIFKDVYVIREVSMVVLNAAVVYNTALLTHDTTTGEVKPFDGTETDRFVGWHFGDTVTGNASGARERAQVKAGGFIFKDLPVTGLANTSADFGELVFASDDGTYTLVTTTNKLVGRIIADDARASGQASVFMFPIIDGVVDAAAT